MSSSGLRIMVAIVIEFIDININIIAITMTIVTIRTIIVSSSVVSLLLYCSGLAEQSTGRCASSWRSSSIRQSSASWRADF